MQPSRRSTIAPIFIQSRDNPLLKDLRRLGHEAGAYRKTGLIWVEGEHLCQVVRERGLAVQVAVFAQSQCDAQGRPPAQWLPTHCQRIAIVPDALLAACSELPSPAGMGYVLALPQSGALDPHASTVVLDRVQDAGNVGSILRTAAAMGVRQVIALKGTAALWSAKVLRAGMGAHWALSLIEAASLEEVRRVRVPLMVTSSHAGQWLHTQRLPQPCAWAFGHEGQGVSAELQALATQHVRIAQPGGQESLNVAAAAAICLHASATAALCAT